MNYVIFLPLFHLHFSSLIISSLQTTTLQNVLLCRCGLLYFMSTSQQFSFFFSVPLSPSVFPTLLIYPCFANIERHRSAWLKKLRKRNCYPVISGQSLLAISVIIRPAKTRADSWTAGPVFLLLLLLFPQTTLILAENRWVAPSPGGIAEECRGGKDAAWTFCLCWQRTLCFLKTSPAPTDWQTLWLLDNVVVKWRFFFFFFFDSSPPSSLGHALFWTLSTGNRINTGDTLHKYSVLSPPLRLLRPLVDAGC